jgi:phosphate transport system substrate-binding protein
MYRAPHVNILLLLLICSSLVRATPATQLLTIHIRGSSTLLPMAQHIAQIYMEQNSNATVVVSGGNTASGIKALMDGTADIALCSGQIPDTLEKELARRNMLLENQFLKNLPILVLAQRANPVSTITLQQLKKIYTGQIRNWKDLGGPDLALSAYLDMPYDELHQNWKNALLNPDEHFSPDLRKDSTPRLTRITEQGTLLYRLEGDLPDNSKILNIDGFSANASSAQAFSYPLQLRLSLVYAKNPSPPLSSFIQFFQKSVQNPPSTASHVMAKK